MKGYNKKSLLFRLIWFVAAILGFFLLSFFLIVRYAENIISENTQNLNERILWQVESRMEDFLNSLDNVVSACVYSPTILEYYREEADRTMLFDEVSSVFSNTELIEDGIEGIYLYDNDQNCIASMGKTDEKPRSIREPVSKRHLGNAYVAVKSKKKLFSAYFPVYDIDSRQYANQIGMCVLALNCSRLDSLLENSQATEHTSVYFIDGNNRVLAKQGAEGQSFLSPSMLTEDKEHFIQIRQTEVQGWRIVSCIPKNELYKSSDGLTIFLAVECVIAVLLIILLIFYYYRIMIWPLHQVESFINRTVKEPEARLESGREDEIGTIIQSLNRMLDDKERMYGEIQQSQKQMYEIELDKKQLQIMAYRNQINPHFLYNTFECIRAMALYYEAEEIAEITMALSHVFRFAVKAENIVTVADEIRYVEEYATIIEYRFMGKIDVDIEAEEAVKSKKVPKLLLQPLVENAVFHGLEQKIEDGEVCVSIRMFGEHYMLFEVRDNGCGIQPEKLEQIRENLEASVNHKGIGIANIYQRLRLFYGEDMKFTINSIPGQETSITIIIPDEVSKGGNVRV